MHESISKYIIFVLRKIILHLKKFKVKNKMEDIHEVRVYIKKLRAVLKMAEELHNIKFKTKILNRIFDDAGILRELQVDIRLLDKYKKQQTKLFDQLKKKLKKEESDFHELIPGYVNKLTKLENEDLFKQLSWPQQTMLKKYFTDEVEKAVENFKSGKRKNMHHFRMQLKRIMYNYYALPSARRASLTLNPKSIDTMQDKVGKWHDLYVFVKLLEKYKLDKKKTFSDIIKNEQKAFDKSRIAVNSLAS